MIWPDDYINKILQGDCLELMKGIPDKSVDAVITDPPAGISFMGKEWDTFVRVGEYACGNKELMAFQEFIYMAFKEVIRVLKPGGHAFVWAIPRTSHHTAMGIERVGFEIRDCVYHVFGSGFPKSLSIGKAVDKLQGNEREAVGRNPNSRENCDKSNTLYESGTVGKTDILTKGTSEWEGWGTALKPAVECWWLCRKPLEKGLTVAENCLKWGTGGIDIDGSRVEIDPIADASQLRTMNRSAKEEKNGWGMNQNTGDIPQVVSHTGRFPANLIHDNSEEVRECFPETKPSKKAARGGTNPNPMDWGNGRTDGDIEKGHDDNGGNASRFFKSIIYQAKASKSERNMGCDGLEEKEIVGDVSIRQNGVHGQTGKPNKPLYSRNNHPTVKPLALMVYLINMITRKGQTVLDPFAGSGTTLMACKELGRKFIGIELDPGYCEIARKRVDAIPERLL